MLGGVNLTFMHIKHGINMTTPRVKPFILCILDGWGNRTQTQHNAIALADTPHFERWQTVYKHNLIGTHGAYVGLPDEQMGNSEVGHMNIGAGRVALPEFGRIDAMLGDGSFADIPTWQDFIKKLQQGTKTCHLMGLLSDGGVHSHQNQMVGMAKLLDAAGIKVYIHAFTDGRDTPPKSAIGYIEQFLNDIVGTNIQIATISGRFYAMDRDNRWERIEQAYDIISLGQGEHFATATDAVHAAYRQDLTDEFIVPVAIGDYQGMNDGDGLLMSNFRADRAREILTAFLNPDFSEFTRKKTVNFADATGVIQYAKTLDPYLSVLVRPLPYPDGLGEVISKAGLRQLRIAETEKYAHVTFFFNGGQETPFPQEDRILVPSPKVRTYDMKPEMAAFDVTQQLLQVIDQDLYDVIIVNFANADMVGHTGNLQAARQAITALDECLGKIEEKLQEKQGAMFVTADHGNAEMMFDEAGNCPHTQHTTCYVPSILVDPCGQFKNITLNKGKLADIAPTILALLNLDIPDAMTGNVLIQQN